MTTQKTDLKSLQKKSGTEIAKMKPKDQVRTLLAQNQAAIAKILPKHVTPDRMMQVALTAFTTTPALQDCYIPSLISSVVQASSMGLEPNTALGHAYLLPFKNNQKNRMDCQLIIGYRGMIDLARRSGEIISISAHAVYQNDDFAFEYGIEEKLRHIPSEDGHPDNEDLTHAYAIAHLKGGGHVFEVMTKKQIDKARSMSKTGGSSWGPWAKHYEEMARKTVIRRLFKYLPASIQMASAVQVDEEADRGEQHNIFEGDFTVEGAEQDAITTDMVMGGDVDEETGEVVEPAKKKAPPPKKKAAPRKKAAKTAAKPDPEAPADKEPAGENVDPEFWGEEADDPGVSME